MLVDADLAGLACSPQDYKKLRTSLRAELSELDDLQFIKARIALVKKLLSYETIYQSPLGSAWEDTARANLEVELTRLEREKAQLCAGRPDRGRRRHRMTRMTPTRSWRTPRRRPAR